MTNEQALEIAKQVIACNSVCDEDLKQNVYLYCIENRDRFVNCGESECTSLYLSASQNCVTERPEVTYEYLEDMRNMEAENAIEKFIDRLFIKKLVSLTKPSLTTNELYIIQGLCGFCDPEKELSKIAEEMHMNVDVVNDLLMSGLKKFKKEYEKLL